MLLVRSTHGPARGGPAFPLARASAVIARETPNAREGGPLVGARRPVGAAWRSASLSAQSASLVEGVRIRVLFAERD